MRTIRQHLIALLILAISAIIATCNKKEKVLECSDVNCISAQGNFFLKFIDKNTGENKIANHTFDTTGIQITNGAGEKIPIFSTASRIDADSLKNTMFFMDNSKIGDNSIQISSKSGTINFTYKYAFQSMGCCGNGDVKNVIVKIYSFTVYPLWPTGNLNNFKIISIAL